MGDFHERKEDTRRGVCNHTVDRVRAAKKGQEKRFDLECRELPTKFFKEYKIRLVSSSAFPEACSYWEMTKKRKKEAALVTPSLNDFFMTLNSTHYRAHFYTLPTGDMEMSLKKRGNSL